MVHPYYNNYPNYYYDFAHHFISRFILFALSVVMIVMAILDYVYVHQTWYTYTINAVTIFAGACGILCCIFVSFTLLEFTCLLFFVLFGVQLASLIYRAVVGITVNSWGYGIAMCAVLFVAWLCTTHLIRWFHAEIIGGTYAGPMATKGGGATTNVAITQPQMPNQQPIVQPTGYGQTSTTTTTAGQPGIMGTGLGTGTLGTGTLGTGLGNTTPQYGVDPYAQRGYAGNATTYPTGPNAAYPQQRTYPSGMAQV